MSCEHSPEEEKLHRRTWLSLTLGGLVGALAATPVIGFLLGPVFKKVQQHWRSVGSLDDFKVGDTVKVEFETTSPVPWSGVTARAGAWVRRTGDSDFIAFSVNCAHLGCPVRFIDDAQLFMCPCHGGVYYADGTVAAGPPPHGLWQYPIRVRNGKVEIETAPLPITTTIT